MDRRIENSSSPRGKFILLALLGILAAAAIGFWLARSPELTVERERLTISTVRADQFYEYINLTGRIEPGETYFIDSKVAGNVERIFVRSGDRVRRGDTLLLISNADLELEVMQRESQLLEQLNAQRQTRLLLDQNDFTRREQLTEISFQLALQEQQFRRDEQLYGQGVIARSSYEPSENRYAYYQRREELLRASFRQDSLRRRDQLRQIDAFESRLLNNLRQVRAILDRLYLTAATDGRLSDFRVQTGQAINSGQRIGEIYSLEEPMIVAEADEFYLERVREGQSGFLIDRGDTLSLTVRRIYPNVENGRFRLDIAPRGSAVRPEEFAKGQSVRLRLLFGRASNSTLLASGNFYGSTGGHWVYRLEDGRALRTPIRLGRVNPDYYEVLEGLQPGDRVITSGYDEFSDFETLKLKG